MRDEESPPPGQLATGPIGVPITRAQVKCIATGNLLPFRLSSCLHEADGFADLGER